MERHAVDEAVAFAMLRNESRDANRKLLDIAAAVVDGTASWPGYRVARSRQYSTRRWGSAGRKRRRSGGQALHERRPPTDREHGHIDNDGRFVRDEKSATGLWRGSGVVGSVCRGASTVACWTDAEAQDFIGAHGYFRSAGQPNSLLPPFPHESNLGCTTESRRPAPPSGSSISHA
jgi:hypothetical protein